MNYSYTQISHYLTCPRRHRHRYLDRWQGNGTRALVEWEVTSTIHRAGARRLVGCGPRRGCASRPTGLVGVGAGRLVRERLVELQYLRTTIPDEQRQEFGQLVDDTVRRIESA